MTVRFYSSTAQISALTGSITNAATSMTLTTVSGWPTSTPFTAVIDPDTPSAEIVNVSATAGPTYTIQRGIDGTSAAAHNGGAVVRHMATARDFADSRAHENASAGVHGIGGGSALVGTTDVQTLTNKTLTAPVINNATFNNIGPLGAYTNFTPTLRANGTPLGGTPATTNAGRYMKVGRQAQVQIETAGNAGMTIPGGDASAITWNGPAALTPRSLTTNFFMPVGEFTVNVGIALGFGTVTYNFADNNFTCWFDAGSFFDGADLKNGTAMSINLTYECAS